MNIDQIRERVKSIPYMSVTQAETITDVISENRFQNILELGFGHGVSTCYIAGAVDDLGRGTITTIDSISAREAEPNIEHLLGSLGLAKYVAIFYEPTSYIWRLMKMLEETSSPRFDFCYIDGAHDWFTDGFAFFLVDRLLKPGGHMLARHPRNLTQHLTGSLACLSPIEFRAQQGRTLLTDSQKED